MVYMVTPAIARHVLVYKEQERYRAISSCAASESLVKKHDMGYDTPKINLLSSYCIKNMSYLMSSE